MRLDMPVHCHLCYSLLNCTDSLSDFSPTLRILTILRCISRLKLSGETLHIRIPRTPSPPSPPISDDSLIPTFYTRRPCDLGSWEGILYHRITITPSHVPSLLHLLLSADTMP